MFARVSTHRGSPDKVEEGIRTMKEITPQTRQLPGLVDAYFFVDRKSGKAITITLWETEAAMRNSASAANPLRERIAKSLGAKEKPTIEVYELVSEIHQQAKKAA